VHSRESGNISTPTYGNWCSNRIAVEKKEKRVYVVYVRHVGRRAVGEPAGDEAEE